VRAPRMTRVRPRALVLAAMCAVLWLVAPAPAASAHATLLAEAAGADTHSSGGSGENDCGSDGGSPHEQFHVPCVR